MKKPSQPRMLRDDLLKEYMENPNICLFCKKKILVKPHERISKVKKRKFCNPSCNASFNNSYSPKKKKKTKICGYCKKEITTRSGKKFCSMECSTKHDWENRHKPRILEGKCHTRHTLRNFLIKRDGDKCSVCELTEWQGKSITMEVDHINGDPSNNRPENIRLICPNCHSQTEFFCGRNKGNGRGSRGLPTH